MKKEVGFSLIELVAAMAILAVLAGISGYVYLSGLPQRRVMAASRHLYAGIHEARSEAVKRCERVSIVFNAPSGNYEIRDANGTRLGGPYHLPESIEFDGVTGSSGSGAARFTFNSRGMKTNARSGRVKVKYCKSGSTDMQIRVTSTGAIAIENPGQKSG